MVLPLKLKKIPDMRLFDTILLSLAIGFFIIGVLQLMTVGMLNSYWIFMLSIILLGWYQLRKKKSRPSEAAHPGTKRKNKKPGVRK